MPSHHQDHLRQIRENPEIFWGDTSEPSEEIQELVTKFNKISTKGKRDFLSRAKNLSQGIKDKTYLDLANNVRGVDTNSFYGRQKSEHMHEVLGEILFSLNMTKHAKSTVQNNQFLNPNDGPKSSYDLWLITWIGIASLSEGNRGILDSEYMMSDEEFQIMSSRPEALAAKALFKLANHSRHMMDDIPKEYLRERLNQDLPVIDKVLDNYSSASMETIGFSRYFLEHNKEKLSAKNSAVIDDCIKTMFFYQMKTDIASVPYAGNFESDDYVDQCIEVSQGLFLEEYRNITVSDVLKEINENLDGSNRAQRNIEELENRLDQRPEGMQEVVLLHYAESKDLRKLRRDMFKSKWSREGGYGPKRAFIQDLAINHSSDLESIGLASADIEDMRESGKLPEGCGYNIEHIIDREHGGTNHDHNFILMPEDINDAKNQLKMLQKTLHKNADDGCWIVSWVPEKDENGMYPKVFTGHLDTNSLQLESSQENDAEVLSF